MIKTFCCVDLCIHMHYRAFEDRWRSTAPRERYVVVFCLLHPESEPAVRLDAIFKCEDDKDSFRALSHYTYWLVHGWGGGVGFATMDLSSIFQSRLKQIAQQRSAFQLLEDLLYCGIFSSRFELIAFYCLFYFCLFVIGSAMAALGRHS